MARGAAYYGWTKHRGGVRIRGGTARAYYVGIETAGLAVPGAPRPLRALCVVPIGMEEGTETDVPSDEIGLVVGEPAHFRFFSSSVRKEDRPGDVLSTWTPEELSETDSLETALPPDAVDRRALRAGPFPLPADGVGRAGAVVRQHHQRQAMEAGVQRAGRGLEREKGDGCRSGILPLHAGSTAPARTAMTRQDAASTRAVNRFGFSFPLPLRPWAARSFAGVVRSDACLSPPGAFASHYRRPGRN